MKKCKKAILFAAGTISIALDSVAKAIDEATESVEKERTRISGKLSKTSTK